MCVWAGERVCVGRGEGGEDGVMEKIMSSP